jgi:exodeoxyribonuclease V alpha subunit
MSDFKKGSNIIWNGKIYQVFSKTLINNEVIINYNNNPNHRLNYKKEKVTKLLNKDDYLLFRSEIFKVIGIKENKNNVVYKLQNIIDEYVSTISFDNINLSFISDEYQNKLNSFIKFILKYNANKYIIKNDLVIKFEEVYNVFENIVIYCKIKANKLYDIFNYAKYTKSDDVFKILSITNIFKMPGNFITKKYQLITYKAFINICKHYEINVSEEIKIEKWIYYYFLVENKFYVPKYKFIKDIEKEFKISITKIMINLQQKNKFMYIVIDKKEYATTDYLYNFEKSMGDLFLDLYYKVNYDIEEYRIKQNIQDFYRKYHKYQDVDKKGFNVEQENAIVNSIKNKFSIVNGPPGTGKTSVATCILYLLNVLCNIEYENISIMAPTGKAYMNIKDSILNKGAFFNETKSGTLHKILYGNNNKNINNKYINNEYNNNEYKNNNKIDVIVVDEVSMIDNFLLNDLLKKCKKENCRLIFLGDDKQLPSVKAGIILNKLVNFDYIDENVNRLNTIHRQSGGLLLDSIYKMTRNEIIAYNTVNDNTLYLKNINEINDDNIYHQLQNLISDNNLNIDNCKFICPFKTDNKFIHTGRINSILQNIFNPISEANYKANVKYNKIPFRPNDKIIRTENSYDDNIMRANGQEATIVNYDANMIDILYEGDENKVKIDIDELYDAFELNYCITTHKSQGSQYENVIYLIDDKATDFFVDHTNIYTAISRAKSRCIIYTNLNKFEKYQKKHSDRVSLFMKEFNEYDIM